MLAGYYRQGSHRLINLNQCPIQDERLNPLLAEVKQDILRCGWSIYDEDRHTGQVRHLALRIGRHTGEILLTLVVTDWGLYRVGQQAKAWMQRYPNVVGVSLNHNPRRTNVIFGTKTRCIAGKPYLIESFAGLKFQIRPETFFQIYTEQAEALLRVILTELNLQGHELLLDAYCGIGTLTLPLAQHVQQAVGLELQEAAVHQARINANLNQIKNVRFTAGAVEDQLAELDQALDVIVLDPPRKGCDRRVIDALLKRLPRQLVYVSCKPTTLARDIRLLCEGGYQLTRIQPVDFFPQTAHVECVAFLRISA